MICSNFFFWRGTKFSGYLCKVVGKQIELRKILLFVD
jgi:hypothetical protein